MSRVVIVYHSGFGHTKLQAEAVHRGADSVEGIEALLMTAEEASDRLDELDSAEAIILGSPTYMGTVSAGMKQFMETAAKKWFTLAWKDKIAGSFTNSSSYSGDKFNTLLALTVNAMQHGMIYVSLGIHSAASDPESMNNIEGPGPEVINRLGSYMGPMAASFQVAPGDAPSTGDIATAEAYGERVANITQQFVRGRAA